MQELDAKTTTQIAIEMQEMALSEPQYYKHDNQTVDDKFKRILIMKELEMEVILTIDCDEKVMKEIGCPVWHCSVSYPVNSAYVAMVYWQETFKRIAEEVCKFILRQVGDVSQKHVSYGIYALHYRRKLNKDEMQKIGAL